MVLFFGADDVRLLSGKHPSRMIRRVTLDIFICALAENSPPDCFLNARLQIRLSAFLLWINK